MLKVAILDDYQNVSHEFVNLKNLSKKYEFKIFSEPFINEDQAIEQLNMIATKGKSGEVYHIGSGQAIKMKET